MEKEEIMRQIKCIIDIYAGVNYQVLLFGSWAKGNALEVSDIDIGILGKEKLPWSLMVKILEEVEKIPTLRKIDIVDLNTKDNNFKKSVLNYAKVLN